MPRLFVAIDLPDDVRGVLTNIRRDLSAARWVPENQLHLTLRFIGDADAGTFALIRKGLQGAGGVPFDLSLKGIGHFPPGRRARVLWVGVSASGELQALQAQVEQKIVAVGMPAEERPFVPHITLARFKETPPAGELEHFEGRYGALTLGPFTVREFHLYSSILSGTGATHRIEGTYPLSG